MEMRHQKSASPVFSTYTFLSTSVAGITPEIPSSGKGLPSVVSSWSVISSVAVVMTL